jgi:hypothetical protein
LVLRIGTARLWSGEHQNPGAITASTSTSCGASIVELFMVPMDQISGKDGVQSQNRSAVLAEEDRGLVDVEKGIFTKEEFWEVVRVVISSHAKSNLKYYLWLRYTRYSPYLRPKEFYISPSFVTFSKLLILTPMSRTFFLNSNLPRQSKAALRISPSESRNLSRLFALV